MAKTFEGRRVKSPTDNQRLYSPTTPQFHYMHHPNTWDLVETDNDWEILPMLHKFQLIAGLNGISLRPGGGIDSTAARAAFMDQGWTFISSDKAGEGGYLREFDGVRGSIYVDKWTSPRKIGHGTTAKVIWDQDIEGYNDFRRSLLQDGTVNPPDQSALDWKIELLEKRINRKTKAGHIPQVQVEIKKASDTKEALITIKNSKTPRLKKKKAPAKRAPKVAESNE